MSLNTRISNVRHNAETGCFEADVTLIDGTDSFTYAVEWRAPIDRDFDHVQSALISQAEARHDPAHCPLIRKRVAWPLQDRSEDIANRILFAGPSYLDQILGRAA